MMLIGLLAVRTYLTIVFALIDGAIFGLCIRHFDFSEPRRILRFIEIIDVLDGSFNLSLFHGPRILSGILGKSSTSKASVSRAIIRCSTALSTLFCVVFTIRK